MEARSLSAKDLAAIAVVAAAASGATVCALAWCWRSGLFKRDDHEAERHAPGCGCLGEVEDSKSLEKDKVPLKEEEAPPESSTEDAVVNSDTEEAGFTTPDKRLKLHLPGYLKERSISLPTSYSPVRKADPKDPRKRQGYLSWDDYFMAIAFLSAQRSKDPNRQVGACIVSKERIILGIGYNGFPRGCDDDKLPWAKISDDGDPLKTKYPYVCHAEVNAILNRNQALSSQQRLYVTMFPCNECAKLIIQAGIEEVVYFTDKGSADMALTANTAKPEVAYAASKRLLALAGVKFWQHRPVSKAITLEFR